jgi:AhpD family alkylhydroperoxidase
MRVHPTPEAVQAAFERVQHDPSFDESRALHAAGLPVVEMLQAMALRPEILEAFAGFGKAVYPGGLLERSLKERVILKASLLNECQFCASSHTSLMKSLGIGHDPVADLASEAGLTERERAALAYTEVVTRDSNRVTDALSARLQGLFTEPELVELTFLIGFINMLNRFNNALGVRYRGDYDQSPQAVPPGVRTTSSQPSPSADPRLSSL